MYKTELLLLYILGMIHSHVLVETANLNKVPDYDLKKAKTKTRIKRSIQCSSPRGWNLLGSEWGCCGNYDGCCEYASIICYMHDAMCQCCGSPLCGPKCRPEQSCGQKETHWNPGPILEKTATTTGVHEFVTEKKEFMSMEFMMDEGRFDEKGKNAQQDAENKEDKGVDGEGSGEIPEQ
ncbi:hypothetical protein CHS0354_003492 [Potamilus streckersoni]|uniref:Uncharacterized protein n=1 Tax=Potamilus streckersoni TaxID=2493646 RepID=A0AAE0W543_9BIVA|nr:hypothetical protein CHS0354_003492 [Potamilus streckersoni]